MSEATVFIGICTAASSDMFSGLLDINYLDQIQSTNFLQGQQIMFHTHFIVFFIIVSSPTKTFS